MDYYNILGIDKNADAKNIKKAYHKKAIKEHPDKGGDEEKFKKIARAYEILSDPEKRTMYDKYGEEGLKGTTFSSASDLFSMFFGQTKKKETTYFHELKVKLLDMYTGTQIRLNITRRRVIYPEGIDKENALIICKNCGGNGMIQEMVTIAFGICKQTNIPCNKCNGRGKYMRKGIQINKEKKLITINIKSGAKHGDKIFFKGESDEEPGELPKDLVFIIIEIPDKNFKRNGDHLVRNFSISVWQALCGQVIEIPFIDNSIIKIKSSEVLTPDKTFCVPGKGIKSYANLYINFKIKYPEKLLFSEKEYIQKKFGESKIYNENNIITIHSKKNMPQSIPQSIPQSMPFGIPFGMPQGIPMQQVQPECVQQ